MADIPRPIVLVGGFLGAGKTTAILRLAKQWIAAGQRVAILTNDQAEDLVDTETFRAAGLSAAEVAGGCFCCRFDDLIARADELVERTRPDVILAEPVGSCTDIVATVVNPLRCLHPDRWRVAPFTVLVDGARALKVLARTEQIGLSERVTYIYRMQQQEADVVAVNKIDLLTPAERERVESLVREQLPGRDVILVSARTGEGFVALAAMLDSGDVAGGRALGDLDYHTYAEGEAELGWLNTRVELVADSPIAIDEALLELGRNIHEALHARSLAIAHGKLLLRAGADLAVLNMLDGEQAPELSRSSSAAASELELLVNQRVQAEPLELTDVVQAAILAWTERRGLEIVGGSGQCFKPLRPVPTHRIGE